MSGRRYRGKRAGLNATQTEVVAILVIIAVLAMTMHVNGQYGGMSAGEQLHEALFETEDWS